MVFRTPRPASAPLQIQEQRQADALTRYHAEYTALLEASKQNRGLYYLDNIQFRVNNLFGAYKALDMETNSLIAKCTNQGAKSEAEKARIQWGQVVNQMRQSIK